MKFTELFGWYGTIAIVGAYAMVSFGTLDSNSLTYQLLNLTGSLGIVILSAQKQAYQPAVLNAVWCVIGAIAIINMVS